MNKIKDIYLYGTSKKQKINLTGFQYDKIVKLYEKTKQEKYLKILQNCTISYK